MIEWSPILNNLISVILAAVGTGMAGLCGFGMNYLLKQAQTSAARKEQMQAEKHLSMVNAKEGRRRIVENIVHYAVYAVEQIWRGREKDDLLGALRRAEALEKIHVSLTKEGLQDDVTDSILDMMLEGEMTEMRLRQQAASPEQEVKATPEPTVTVVNGHEFSRDR